MNAEDKSFDLYRSDEDDLAFANEIDELLESVRPPLPIVEIEQKTIEAHQITGEPLSVCAFRYGLPINDKKWWKDPDDIHDDQESVKIDLIGKYKNPIVDMSRAVAKSVQFPLNTTFLHIVGVMSSTTIRKFTYRSRYGAPKHCGLYTLGAQPPSTGKSPTNKLLVDPIKHYVDAENEKNEPLRMLLEDEIKRLEKEFDKCKVLGERRDIAEKIIDKRKDLLELSEYTWGITDGTAEGIEESAAKQHGRFSIVSDEAEAVSVVFGLYNKGEANLGFVLKGFDGGDQLTLRIGRKGYKGTVIGAVAVLAQESTVTKVLGAGREGGGSRGICERFLIISEPNIIHEKNHRVFVPVPSDVEKTYLDTVAAIVNQQFDVCVYFSDAAIDFIITILEGLQVHISDGGKYANELMRGVIGKAETQICKIAATLHIAKEWSPKGKKNHEISVDEVAAAANMYIQIIKSFVGVAANEGVAGKELELQVAAKRLKAIINNPKKPRLQIKYADFADSLRNTAPFSSVSGLRKYVLGLIPDLQKSCFIVFDEEKKIIFINPKLKD